MCGEGEDSERVFQARIRLCRSDRGRTGVGNKLETTDPPRTQEFHFQRGQVNSKAPKRIEVRSIRPKSVRSILHKQLEPLNHCHIIVSTPLDRPLRCRTSRVRDSLRYVGGARGSSILQASILRGSRSLVTQPATASSTESSNGSARDSPTLPSSPCSRVRAGCRVRSDRRSARALPRLVHRRDNSGCSRLAIVPCHRRDAGMQAGPSTVSHPARSK